MKRFFSMLVMFVLFLCVTGSLHAFTSKGISVSTAAVNFTGAGSVQASVSICNILDGSATTQIWWDTTQINLGQTAWRRADAYIVLTSTITSSIGAMQIYTDNTNTTGNYPQIASLNSKYLGVSTTSAAGLVGYLLNQPMVSSTTLSLCWRILDTTSSVTGVNPSQFNIQRGAVVSGVNYPDRIWDLTTPGGTSLAQQYPCWHWMEDKMNGGAPNETDYIVLKDAIRGIQQAEYTWSSNCPSPDYIYFGANFTSALSGVTYMTNTITIEAYTE